MIIVPYRYGQLGNQLFHVAHLYAAHKLNGHRVLFCCFGYDKQYFPNIDSNPRFRVRVAGNLTNRLLRKSTVLHRQFCGTLSSGLISHLYCESPPYIDSSADQFNEACRKKIFICEGWGFRDNSSMQVFRSEIINFLSFSNEIKHNSKKFISSIRKTPNCCLVAFHVRRGDYQFYKDGQFYLSDDDWRSAIDTARRVVESQGRAFRPIIFSNEDCEALKDIKGIVFAKGNIYTDLQSLSSCDLIVAPPSTFSGWASYLGNVKFAQVDNCGHYEKSILSATPILW